MAYRTLGDIADELRVMRYDGMTRSSIQYALDKVFWEEAAAANRPNPCASVQIPVTRNRPGSMEGPYGRGEIAPR